MAYGYLDTPAARSTRPSGSEGEARRVGHLVNAVGAVLSVALVAGVGLWSYRLMVRDVSGVPVVQALDGPMRVSPADPGGRQASYQGLAVNSVAAQQGAATVSRDIALAPQPADIAPEDMTRRPPRTEPAAPPGDLVDRAETGLSGRDLAAQAALTEEIIETVPLGTPGIARSPLPPRRPERVVQTALTAPAVARISGDAQAEAALQDIATRLSSPQVTDIEPTSLTAGTRLVQLGAYASDDEARQAWADLASRFPGYLDGRGRVVEAATAGGRLFYRLRAHGFRDEPEARRFCSVFLAEDVDCTPVLIR